MEEKAVHATDKQSDPDYEPSEDLDDEEDEEQEGYEMDRTRKRGTDEDAEDFAEMQVIPDRLTPKHEYRSLKLKRKVATTANSLMEREKKKHKPTIPWVERIEELTAFRARFGHCNVPKEWPENPGLATFVKRMRYEKKIGNLEPDRVKALEDLDFKWALRQTDTQDFLGRLKSFKELHGHLNIPNNRITAWCSKMRQKKVRGELEQDIISELDALGFNWTSPKNQTWDTNIAKLKAFKAKHGHCRVPKKYTDPALREWCQRQKCRYKWLPERKRNILLEMGFEFSTTGNTNPTKQANTWNGTYTKLKEFKKKHGNLDKISEEEQDLHKWVQRMRNLEVTDSLADDKKAMLDALGVKWMPRLSIPEHPTVPTAAPDVPPQDWETIEIIEL